jgi:hypothetical protein
MPVRFEVASGPVLVHGAIVDVDATTGRATNSQDPEAGRVVTVDEQLTHPPRHGAGHPGKSYGSGSPRDVRSA